ncbi:MAG: hypothetical protein OHK0039_11360 [Bacteroidia bacterium]
MRKTSFLFAIAFAATFFVAACSQGTKTTEEAAQDAVETIDSLVVEADSMVEALVDTVQSVTDSL